MSDTFTLKFAAVVLAGALAALGILAVDAGQAAPRTSIAVESGVASERMICRNDAHAAPDDKVRGLSRSDQRLGRISLERAYRPGEC